MQIHIDFKFWINPKIERSRAELTQYFCVKILISSDQIFSWKRCWISLFKLCFSIIFSFPVHEVHISGEVNYFFFSFFHGRQEFPYLLYCIGRESSCLSGTVLQFLIPIFSHLTGFLSRVIYIITIYVWNSKDRLLLFLKQYMLKCTVTVTEYHFVWYMCTY